MFCFVVLSARSVLQLYFEVLPSTLRRRRMFEFESWSCDEAILKSKQHTLRGVGSVLMGQSESSRRSMVILPSGHKHIEVQVASADMSPYPLGLM